MKKYLKLFLFAFICILSKAFANEFLSNYTQAVEKIIFYKNDKLKVFYGGPVDNEENGVRWVMSAMFEDEYYKTRAVYEIAFVNCDINNAEDAEVLFVKVSDINIKFQNELSKDYEIFSKLLLGKYKPNKYIVVRSTDFSIVYFPEVVLSEASGFLESDKEKIVDFLHNNFKTRKKFLNFYEGNEDHEIDFEDQEEIVFKPFPIKINFHGKPQSFLLTRRIQKMIFGNYIML